MLKIRRIKLVNFSAIYLCTGEYELEFYRSDNPICVLIGGNGSGKTSIMTELTPAHIENLQGRSESRILEDKVGKKELDIELNNKYLYKIEILYEKKTSCFIHKYNLITKEDYGELNPNGNVNSYYDVLEKELGYTKNYINIGFLNSRLTDIINMTAANRSNYIQVWLPQISEYIDSYSIAQKRYNVIKKQIELLNNDIGKLSDTDYDILINNHINSLDSLNTTYNNYQEIYTKNKTYISIINSDLTKSSLDELIENFKNNVSLLSDKRNLILNETKLFSKYIGSIGKKALENDIKHNETQLTILTTELKNIDNNLITIENSIEEEQSKLTSDNRENIINITELLRKIEDEITDLVVIKENLEKENKILISFKGISVKTIDNYVNLMDDLRNYYDKINSLISIDRLKDFSTINTLITDMSTIDSNCVNIMQKLDNEILYISNQIYGLENSTITQELLKLKPINCISDCGIVNEIIRHINPEQEINSLKVKLSEKIDEKAKIKDQYDENKTESINYKIAVDLVNEINHKLYKNNDLFNSLPEVIRDTFKELDIYKIYNNIPKLLIDYKKYEDYVYLIDKINISKEVLKNTEIKFNLLKEQENGYNNYRKLLTTKEELNTKRNDIIQQFTESNLLIDKLNSLNKLQEKNNHDISTYNTQCENLEVEKRNLKKKVTEWYVKGTLYDNNVILQGKLLEIKNEINEITSKLEEIRNKKNSIKTLLVTRDNLIEKQKKIEILMRIWSPKTGYPSWQMEEFLDSLTEQTNKDLESVWGSGLKIESFRIGSNEFSIPVYRETRLLKDVSECSDGERNTLALAISFAIIEINLRYRPYNIIRLDEVDAVFDTERRRTFMDMILNRLPSLDSGDAYIISHNNNIDDIEADLVILKNADLSSINLSNKNIIYQY
jgi:DNA repair exonuclease SbcCD ATPase subunit